VGHYEGMARVCFVVAVSAVAVSCAPAGHADEIPTTAVVLKAVDGDTVDLPDDVRGRILVQLLGIDTPGTTGLQFVQTRLRQWITLTETNHVICVVHMTE
jgi:endonuclease YncB( thermonuclease family)